MAQRSKRLLKKRSKTHQSRVKARRKVKKNAHPKVGYGARLRRKKKLSKRRK